MLDATELIVTPPPRELPAGGLAGALVVLGSVVAGFMTQWAAVQLWVPPAQQTTVWLPGGVFLALALLVRPQRWWVVMPAAGAGQSLLFIVMGLVTPKSAIVLGVLNALHACLVAAALRRTIRPRITLRTFREFRIYAGVALIVGSLVASALFMGGAAWMQYRPASFLIWRTFTLSAVLGYLTVTPTIVLAMQEAETIRPDNMAHRLEAIVMGALLVLASSLVFGRALNRSGSWSAFALVIPPLLLWAAIRFRALGAAASVLLVSVVSTFGTARGYGPFGFLSAGENTLALQLFMLATGIPLIGLAIVLFEQRLTMSALRTTHARLGVIHGHLLAAREEESTRIARELHDDLGQRLALVSIGLSRLRRAMSQGAAAVADVARLQEQTSGIARSVRELSHELHPAALEHVGLANALQTRCDEITQVTGLGLRFTAEGETADLSPEIALCLFRVAQEALTNVVRHAAARQVTVSLHRWDAGISLEVDDDGRGFSVDSPSGRGLGLHSALERARQAGGTLTVRSAPDRGTTIHVNIPLSTNHA